MYDQMRRKFAEFANKFSEFINAVRSSLNSLNKGTLEEQLAEVKKQEKLIRNSRHDLDLVENLNKELEVGMYWFLFTYLFIFVSVLVFDNTYTSQSALGLSQAWDGLLQMCGRLQRSLQAQIDARSRTGIPEERLQEWKDGFNHFDEDQKGNYYIYNRPLQYYWLGRLDFIEIKSLFRSLGIELALKEGDQESEEFVEILNTINPTIEGILY